MIVLSTCHTALGRESGGEGLLGLSGAFQYAGARPYHWAAFQLAGTAD